MARGVQQRDDADALCVGIADDGIHLRLGELVAVGVIIISPVARLDSGLDRLAVIGGNIDGNRHIIQQEAKAVVAESQFQMRIAGFCDRIDQADDPVFRKILTARIQMHDLVERAGIQRHGGRRAACRICRSGLVRSGRVCCGGRFARFGRFIRFIREYRAVGRLGLCNGFRRSRIRVRVQPLSDRAERHEAENHAQHQNYG